MRDKKLQWAWSRKYLTLFPRSVRVQQTSYSCC